MQGADELEELVQNIHDWISNNQRKALAIIAFLLVWQFGSIMDAILMV